MLPLSGSFITITEQRPSVLATTETRPYPTHLLMHDNMMTTQEKQDAPEPCHCPSKPVHCSFQRIDNSRMKGNNNNNKADEVGVQGQRGPPRGSEQTTLDTKFLHDSMLS